MEGNQTELASLLAGLSQNPAMLSMLGTVMSALQSGSSQTATQAQPQQPQRTASPNPADLLSLLGAVVPPAPNDGLSKLFGTKEEMCNRIALLNAVSPYLSPARREKLDTVIRILKLAELGKLTPLLGKI